MINNTPLNEYGQNTISLQYFNICLLAFHCHNNIENNCFTLFKFATPPEHTEAINDNLRDKIRRVNNSVMYLGNAINGLTNFYKSLNQEKNPEAQLFYQNLYRQMCRNACVELFVYFEKIKSLIRYYFDFNLATTKKNQKFMEKLKSIRHVYIEINNLYNVIEGIEDDGTFRKIMRVRHDEIHNESQIDNLKYSFLPPSPEGLGVKIDGYFVSDDELYYDILHVLRLGNKMRDAMQLVIDKISRSDFYYKIHSGTS